MDKETMLDQVDSIISQWKKAGCHDGQIAQCLLACVVELKPKRGTEFYLFFEDMKDSLEDILDNEDEEVEELS